MTRGDMNRVVPLSALPRTDTRELFRPVSSELVTLLRALPASEWQRPTVAGSWRVREVVAHLVDVTCRDGIRTGFRGFHQLAECPVGDPDLAMQSPGAHRVSQPGQ